MKAKIAPVFKNRDLLRRIIEILNVDFALRSKEEETELVDFLRVSQHLTPRIPKFLRRQTTSRAW